MAGGGGGGGRCSSPPLATQLLFPSFVVVLQSLVYTALIPRLERLVKLKSLIKILRELE